MEKPTLSDSALFYLAEIRKWAKFIAIVGYVMCGILIIVGILMGMMLGITNELTSQAMPFPPYTLSIFYIIVAIVYFFPMYYLFKFSDNLGSALEMGLEEQLTRSFHWLKKHYKFIGILTIVSIGLSVLSIIGAVLAGIFGFFASTGY